jgi:NADPH-dependent curcumin reductase CurA
VEEGKVKGREQVWRGLEKWGEAMHAVFTGANTGKAVVVVADE